MDEGVAALRGRDFALVIVDADDVVAHLSEADSGDQADIAGTDNGNIERF